MRPGFILKIISLMLNFQLSRELRKKYEQELKDNQLITRKVMINYYENQLRKQPKFLKCSTVIKIPKVETAIEEYSKCSEVYDYRLEQLAELLRIKFLRSLLKEMRLFGSAMRFVLTRVRKTQNKVFDALILNYNRQVQKQAYARVVHSFQFARVAQKVKKVLQIWKQSTNRKQILQQIQLRQAFNQWKAENRNPYLQWVLKIWREYVLDKKCKRKYQERRQWQCFISWKYITKKRKLKGEKMVESKEHYNMVLKKKAFDSLLENASLRFEIHYNEFLSESKAIF